MQPYKLLNHSASFAQKEERLRSLFKSIVDGLEDSVQFCIVVHVAISSEFFMNQLVVYEDVENTRMVHVRFAGNGDFLGPEFVQNLRLDLFEEIKRVRKVPEQAQILDGDLKRRSR